MAGGSAADGRIQNARMLQQRGVSKITMVICRFSTAFVVSCLLVHCAAEDCASQGSSLNIPEAARWILIITLVSMSAMFSGLTLGICGFDILTLQVIKESGSEVQKKQAAKIMPVREDGNLLLCTLLLGNVAVNSALSILMADIAGGVVGFIASTSIIVLLGEISPQAICSRHPLPIGAFTSGFVRVLIFIMYPVAKPIAMTLDKVLGEEMTAKYSKQQLIKLLDIQTMEHHVLSESEQKILSGALRFKDKTVKLIMTKLDRVQMLNINERFDFETLMRLYQGGHSRIPVFEDRIENVVGLIFVKDCILLNPDDEVPVRTIMNCHPRTIRSVDVDTPLEAMLNSFKQWRQHLAFVTDVNDNGSNSDPIPIVVGVVTLEDCIEELIADELVDETDEFISNESTERTARKTEVALMQLFGTRIRSGQGTLTKEEAMGVHSYLQSAHADLFGKSVLSDVALGAVIARSQVIDVSELPPQIRRASPIVSFGASHDFAVLLLQGKFDVEIGAEKVRSRLGAFTLIGSACLASEDGTAVSEMTLLPAGSVRFIKFPHAAYVDEVRKAKSGAVAVSIREANVVLPSTAMASADDADEGDGDVEVGASGRSGRSKVVVRDMKKLLATDKSSVL